MPKLSSPTSRSPADRWRCTPGASDTSPVRSGEATASSSRPVAALNSTSRCAVGNPQPSFCPDGSPKALRSSGVSGIEKLEPSTWKVRCPRHRCSASRVRGITASHTRLSSS